MYLAGADLARDLAGDLGERGFTVVTHTTYRMIPVTDLPREVCEGFAAHRVEAVLHYSRRSARAFLEAARAAGVEISALAIPQCCISDAVASDCPRRRGDPGTDGAHAGRKCLIGGADACFAAPDRAKRASNLVRSGPQVK